jgi:hypothetical protein
MGVQAIDQTIFHSVLGKYFDLLPALPLNNCNINQSIKMR